MILLILLISSKMSFLSKNDNFDYFLDFGQFRENGVFYKIPIFTKNGKNTDIAPTGCQFPVWADLPRGPLFRSNSHSRSGQKRDHECYPRWEHYYFYRGPPGGYPTPQGGYPGGTPFLWIYLGL
jgi:hypothetical protein